MRTRRDFMMAAAGATLGAAGATGEASAPTPPKGKAEPQPHPSPPLPQGFYKGTATPSYQMRGGATEILLTENGCASDDVPADDGKVYDTDRIMYLRACLTQLQRATTDGVPVKGYFQWSLMDNFEWHAGFGDRFGLVHVDFKTQKRTPKLSAAWFHAAAGRNAAV